MTRAEGSHKFLEFLYVKLFIFVFIVLFYKGFNRLHVEVMPAFVQDTPQFRLTYLTGVVLINQLEQISIGLITEKKRTKGAESESSK
ncbi:unnamed protein product [Protopolystoma xenopodis]|uniref:Uncharacterized protein n=1 Tax=Protopolystoma xenopodis TaxID=117903 RepID=A0A448WND2_9PLAT|nr:unnamed protein product [Protopolystoma xenopodis]